MNFDIKTKDNVIEFEDIIDLTSEQQLSIQTYALNYSSKELLNCKSGHKINLESWQCEIVLAQKNSLLSGKDEHAIIKDRTVTFTKHSRSRIAVRVDNFTAEAPPSQDSLLLIIKLVLDSEVVDDKAEWKGKNNLVFTLIHTHLDEKFKVSVSFEKYGSDTLKVITVSNEHIDELSQKLITDPNVKKKLIEFKKNILKATMKPQS